MKPVAFVGKLFHGILCFNILGWSQAWSSTSEATVSSSLLGMCIHDNTVKWLLWCIDHLLGVRHWTWRFRKHITLFLLRPGLLSPGLTPKLICCQGLFTTRMNSLMVWHIWGLWILEERRRPNMSSTYYVPSSALGASHLLTSFNFPAREKVHQLVKSDRTSQGFPWT